jgi:hypothetical protein
MLRNNIICSPNSYLGGQIKKGDIDDASSTHGSDN